MMMILSEKKPIFFADTSINQNPTAEDLVNIAKMAEFTVKSFAIEQELQCLDLKNFAAISETSKKVAKSSWNSS